MHDDSFMCAPLSFLHSEPKYVTPNPRRFRRSLPDMVPSLDIVFQVAGLLQVAAWEGFWDVCAASFG